MRGASTISAITATSAALLIFETGFGCWYVQSQMVVETQQQHRHHYPVLSSTPFVPLNIILQSTTEVGDAPGAGEQPGVGSPVDKEGTDSILLPDGFQIGYGPIGFSIVWSPPQSSHIQLRMGNARPEFRLSSSVVFSYPREINNQLHMTLSNEQKEQLVSDGLKLEVWKSGKRLDIEQSSNIGSKVSVLESSETGGYDSIPPDTPKINVDPAARGNYTTRRLSYNLTALTVRHYPIPVEVMAEVYQPRRTTVKSPLVLIIHGRHDTCYKGGPNGQSDINWPCLSGFQPIPSYKGYRYIGDLLATQGYVTVSISTNGISGQDYLTPDWGVVARSKLIRHHLKLIAKWSTNGGDPWNNTLRGKLDMDRVVLVGHGRGGEGVHLAAIEATTTDPFKIVGIVTYGPTAFGLQVTPDVHSATLLPTCDGDVSNLDGQAYIDQSRDIAYSEALRTAVIVLGANNNYFNTEWTPGISQAPSSDDWADNQYDGDPVCGTNGSVRLTAQEQRNVASTYTAALLRLSVYQDIAMLPLLDGSFVRPAAIGRAEVATSAVGGAANRLLYIPGEGSVRFQNGMKGSACSLGWSYSNTQAIPFCAFYDGLVVSTPHFQSLAAPPLLGYELQWTSSIGAVAKFNLHSGMGNLVGYDWIDLRIANDPNKPPVLFDIVVSDSRGRNVTLLLNTSIIDGWPGTYSLDRLQARTLRGRLPQSRQLRSMVDLAHIKAVSLVTRTASGRVWLLDIATSKHQIVTPIVLNLPVVSIDYVVVQEGSTYGTAKIKVRVSSTLGKTGEVWLKRENSLTSIQINVTAGSSSILQEIPVSWTGNSICNFYDFTDYFVLQAKKGVVTGRYAGGLTVLDDDPIPVLSAVSNSATVTEGAFLRWTMKLSSLSSATSYIFRVIPPATGNELFTDDVDQRWIQTTFGFPGLEPLPLSSVNFEIYVGFDYGESTTDIIIPIAVDNKAETNETITLELMSTDWSWNPLQPPILLTGTVLAHK